MKEITDAFKAADSSEKQVHLAFIGLGTPRLGSQVYDRIVGHGFRQTLTLIHIRYTSLHRTMQQN